jgi:hypothetical protein
MGHGGILSLRHPSREGNISGLIAYVRDGRDTNLMND